MLNELHLLERGLAELGVATVARHPDLSQLLKGDVVQVRLKSDGSIHDLKLLGGKDRPDIWTLRDGKHNGFPGLKTPSGLLGVVAADREAHDARWSGLKSVAAKRAEIGKLATLGALAPGLDQWPRSAYRLRLAERLATLRSLADDPDTAAVPAVFERFLKALEQPKPFLASLLEALLERVANGGDEWLDVARRALLDAIPIVIEIEPGSKGRAAGDPRQIAAVSRALAAADGAQAGAAGMCAIGGNTARLLVGPYPQPTLPSLGQTYLLSRNSDIPALARYGRNGPGAFPIEADRASRYSGALAAVTAADRRGISWQLLPAETGDGQDLFIAFVAAARDKPLADLLIEERGEQDEALRTDLLAEAEQQNLVALLEGILGGAPSETARFLLLRSVDPGNRKAVYDRRPTVRALAQAAREWEASMGNVPGWVRWPIFNKARKFVLTGPQPQPPLSLTSLSRRRYVRRGNEVVKVPGIAGAEALALFLAEGDRRRRAARILPMLLDRHGQLLVGTAAAIRRDQLREFDKLGSVRRDGLRVLSWLGALLFFLDRTQEAYMTDTAFRLGQLLSAADTIHMGYCADRRGGDVPPMLVGVSVLSNAGRTPVRALALLQQRMTPYLAWLKRGDEAKSVARQLSERGKRPGEDAAKRRGDRIFAAVKAGSGWQSLAGDLRAQLDGAPVDDSFRAELLLGFIAGLKQEPAKGASDGQEEHA